MQTGEIAGRVLTPTGWIEGRVRWRDGRIEAVEETDTGNDGAIVLPGFIDLHCHGGGGADTSWRPATRRIQWQRPMRQQARRPCSPPR
ncbi:hypothetical protein [Neoaquamicrobium sediminum]|uniref:hypothetical protein n=1 Tax=Neoaquamicrobium sediminum TaxID=1849104 RepID=UPI0019D6A1CE|nr:hypothetical protein [Mesorhizobium sediminum]